MRSLDGSTNTGGSPKCFTFPHALWPYYPTKHQEWPKLGLGSSLALWVVGTVDGAITSTWLVVLSQKSIDALNSYRQLLFDKDITLTIVLFITILQNKQNASCFVTIDSWNSRRIDIIVKATKSFRVRGNVIDKNFVYTSGCYIFLHIIQFLGWSVIFTGNLRKSADFWKSYKGSYVEKVLLP